MLVGDLILMERLLAARSAAAGDGRSPASRGGPAGLRSGAGLHEREGGRATGLAVSVGPLSAAVRVEGAAPVARSVAEVEPWPAPSSERWADRPAFFFDLACPFSYLAAERVERQLGHVEWVPVPSWSTTDSDTLLVRATVMAKAARLPLVLPDDFPAPVPGAMRAAAYAAEIGTGARFALAALRLAFCGGFDLEKPTVLSDVAAAAALSPHDCIAAAAEEWRDEDLVATALLLSSQGVSELPVIGVDGRWFHGLGGLTEAAAWIRRD
jgi:2-hydroxychromene-2-carboxylate isomerase